MVSLTNLIQSFPVILLLLLLVLSKPTFVFEVTEYESNTTCTIRHYLWFRCQLWWSLREAFSPFSGECILCALLHDLFQNILMSSTPSMSTMNYFAESFVRVFIWNCPMVCETFTTKIRQESFIIYGKFYILHVSRLSYEALYYAQFAVNIFHFHSQNLEVTKIRSCWIFSSFLDPILI